jgi:hypothetical protein
MEAPRLLVELPATYGRERSHAARTVLEDLLGYPTRIVTGHGPFTSVRPEGSGNRSLRIADGLFTTPSATWLTTASLPTEPLGVRDVRDELPEARVVPRPLPVLFPTGHRGPLLHDGGGNSTTTLDLDVFGVPFFTLTRYEEVADAGACTDRYGRFPATASLAHRAGFLDRPIADEYAEVLGAALRRVWPGLPTRRERSAVWLTHDVDRPFLARGRSLPEVVRASAGDIRRRRSPPLAGRRLRAYARPHHDDPVDTFDFLMDVAEQAGVRSTFTFLAGGAAPQDGRYSLDDPSIQMLLRRIHARGHELGFHGSFRAFDDVEQVRTEFDALRSAVERLGIHQPQWGGRQHYLRWHNPTTWQAWNDAGLTFDSTVGFADQPGFRSGSCRAHRVFNLAERRELPFIERPLTLMDTTTTSAYLRLDAPETEARVDRLATACRTVGGTFVLLWHNDAVLTPQSRRLYERVVERLT